MKFKLYPPFSPTTPQLKTAKKIVENIKNGKNFQTLLGVTGSGKTFLMALVIEKLNLPTLVISPNKILAAQLYQELKSLFPENAVEYFISYYDYYIPEAYVPSIDLYIAKETLINKEIDRMRLSATRALHERRDVIVVASVSCIYGIGEPDNYFSLVFTVKKGKILSRKRLIEKLIELQFERSDDFIPGTFRAIGSTFDIYPSERELALRIELEGDVVSELYEIDPSTGFVIREIDSARIYPVNFFITPPERLKIAIERIRKELKERVNYFLKIGKKREAKRLEERTLYDIELLEEIGYCPGIENYARHLSLRDEGEPPYTLIDYFPEEFLTFIDESHIAVPQLMGMYRGDRSRKETLVEHGFRLPSALDNRPLKFEEIIEKLKYVVFVSATPSKYEKELSKGEIVELLVRPTGLVDPKVEIRSTKNQMQNILSEIEKTIKNNERILITTLTKRMAEKLSNFLYEHGIKAKYMHSDLDALERVKIIRDLRLGKFDVLVGINLLREGLDLPEVSLIIILDADKEGFLRSETSFIQTFGRAARNVNGRVILYADRITGSMKRAIKETERRRKVQIEYNKKHNITPKTIKKEIRDYFNQTELKFLKIAEKKEVFFSPEEKQKLIEELKKEMFKAAENLEFEKASKIRDKIKELISLEVMYNEKRI